VRSKRWKWFGLGAIAAIAIGSAVIAERRRRHWREYDTEAIRARLHDRFARLDPPASEERGERADRASPRERRRRERLSSSS
jgi:hypothetical protein